MLHVKSEEFLQFMKYYLIIETHSLKKKQTRKRKTIWLRAHLLARDRHFFSFGCQCSFEDYKWWKKDIYFEYKIENLDYVNKLNKTSIYTLFRKYTHNFFQLRGNYSKCNLLKRIWTQKNENQLAVILKLKFRLDERDTRSFEFGCNAQTNVKHTKQNF